MGLFRKGKNLIITKFHRTDLVICSHSREGKIPSYSQINMVLISLNAIMEMTFCHKNHNINAYFYTEQLEKSEKVRIIYEILLSKKIVQNY